MGSGAGVAVLCQRLPDEVLVSKAGMFAEQGLLDEGKARLQHVQRA